MVIVMSVGYRIRLLREGKGMSQSELADKIGVKCSAVSKYERGAIENLPSYRIRKLADVLDTTPEYLLDGRLPLSNMTADEDDADSIFESRPEIEELVHVASELSENDVRKLILFAAILKG